MSVDSPQGASHVELQVSAVSENLGLTVTLLELLGPLVYISVLLAAGSPAAVIIAFVIPLIPHTMLLANACDAINGIARRHA